MNSKFKLFLISFIVLTLVPNIIQIGSAAYSNIPTKFRLPFSGAYYSPTVYQYYDNDTTAGIKSYGCGSKTYNNHKGTDFNVNVDTPIYAAAAGGIYKTGDGCATYGSWTSTCGGGFGNHARVDHEGNTSDGVGLKTIYAHFKLNTVTAPYQSVNCGAFLGKSGSSGKSTAPHVHFEVQKYGYPNDDPFKGNCSGSVSWWTNIDSNGIPISSCYYTPYTF